MCRRRSREGELAGLCPRRSAHALPRPARRSRTRFLPLPGTCRQHKLPELNTPPSCLLSWPVFSSLPGFAPALCHAPAGARLEQLGVLLGTNEPRSLNSRAALFAETSAPYSCSTRHSTRPAHPTKYLCYLLRCQLDSFFGILGPVQVIGFEIHTAGPLRAFATLASRALLACNHDN